MGRIPRLLGIAAVLSGAYLLGQNTLPSLMQVFPERAMPPNPISKAPGKSRGGLVRFGDRTERFRIETIDAPPVEALRQIAGTAGQPMRWPDGSEGAYLVKGKKAFFARRRGGKTEVRIAESTRTESPKDTVLAPAGLSPLYALEEGGKSPFRMFVFDRSGPEWTADLDRRLTASGYRLQKERSDETSKRLSGDYRFYKRGEEWIQAGLTEETALLVMLGGGEF